jgi:hypothetical protein
MGREPFFLRFSSHNFDATGDAQENEPHHEIARLHKHSFDCALGVIKPAAHEDPQAEAAQERVPEKKKSPQIAL